MKLLELKKKQGLLKTIYFIGIGGIGMSGIANILNTLGYKIEGSDVVANDNTKKLEQKGVKVYIGHDVKNIVNVSYVVISSAIKSDNPELQQALYQKIPIINRFEMLAELMRYKCSISVSGSHGKTTTTSLIASLFESVGFNPTVINGGIINSCHTNAYIGSSEYLIAEADESDGTFIKIPSTIGVITNIDREHLDYYNNFLNLIEAFRSFILQLPFYGFAVCCIDNKVVKDLVKTINNRKIITYSIESSDANIQALNIRFSNMSSIFDIKVRIDDFKNEFIIRDVKLTIPGKHNILNALAAVAIGLEFGFDVDVISNSFSNFQGVKRRFTKVMEYNGAIIVDDYAHHPEEVKSTIITAKQIADENNGKVIAIFQPHRYSRMQSLFKEFINCFDAANYVYITNIYSAGEVPLDGVNSENLVEQIKSKSDYRNVFFVSSEVIIPKIVIEHAFPGNVILMMGAGNISNWANSLNFSIVN